MKTLTSLVLAAAMTVGFSANAAMDGHEMNANQHAQVMKMMDDPASRSMMMDMMSNDPEMRQQMMQKMMQADPEGMHGMMNCEGMSEKMDSHMMEGNGHEHHGQGGSDGHNH